MSTATEPDAAAAGPSLPAWLNPIAAALAGLLTLASLLQAADVPSRLGYAYYTEQFLALVLGLSLALVFLAPARFGNGGARAVNLVLGALSLGLGGYVAIAYPSLVGRAMQVPIDGLVVATLLFVLVLEALRRAVGWTLVLVVLMICGYGLIGHLVPGPLQTRQVAPERLTIYLAFDPNALLGLTLSVAATVVVAFVFFGQLLLKSGGAEFFNDLARATMGRRRGGAAKISIVASGLFGSISGVVVSNIVATGVVTIRLMVQGGFRRTTAAAIEAVASTGGQIVPPVMGAVAFLMADMLQRPYADIVVAAIVPALLYYVSLFVQADLQAARSGISRVDESLILPVGRVLRMGWVFMAPFATIVVALFGYNQRPETAALWGASATLAVGCKMGYGGSRARLRDLADAVISTGRSIVDIIIIAASAGFVIGVLNVTGLGFGVTHSLVSVGQGHLLLLLAVAAAVCLVLGMGMPTVGVYLLLAVLVAPSLVDSGVDPIAAHLFIFYLGMMSMVTPPVAIGAFFAASIANAKPMRTAFEAMRFGWTAYIIPFLFVFSPALLLVGTWHGIVFAVGTAILGVYAVSAGFVGYLAGPLSSVRRAAVTVAGALLVLPPEAVAEAGMWTAGAGFFLFAACLLAQRLLPNTVDRKASMEGN